MCPYIMGVLQSEDKSTTTLTKKLAVEVECSNCFGYPKVSVNSRAAKW